MSLRSNMRKWSSSEIAHRDVLLGRSRKSYSHSGNVIFRELVSRHVARYQKKTSRADKAALLAELVFRIHDSGGRFLRFVGGEWVEVPEKIAREKVSHALRDARLALIRESPLVSSASGATKSPSSGLANLSTKSPDQRCYLGNVAAIKKQRALPNRLLPLKQTISHPQVIISKQNPRGPILHNHGNVLANAASGSVNVAMNPPTTSAEQALDYQIQHLIRLRNSIHASQLLDEAAAHRNNNSSNVHFPTPFPFHASTTHVAPAPRPPPAVMRRVSMPTSLPVPQEQKSGFEVVAPTPMAPSTCINNNNNHQHQSAIEQVWFGLPEVSDDEFFHETEETALFSDNTRDVERTIKALENALDICRDDNGDDDEHSLCPTSHQHQLY